jgi:sigma-B regulation protein RsbU (phosphoserine phosphatase)
MISSKILVVDDEPDVETMVRQKFRRQIRDSELSFCFARDGEAALECVRQDPSIDVVISDINMPVMDGLSLLGHLNESNRILRTVVVSAYGDMDNIRAAMNRGAYDFLTKPIDFRDFQTTLDKAIRDMERIRDGIRARDQLTAIQSELSVANRIQQSILPSTSSAFPGRRDFEIFAQMIPARAIGGDFYDFFLIDREHLGFAIGDVSGKGVPAGILMAVSRTLLRAVAMQGEAPGDCLDYVNRILTRESDPAAFVTMFYGVLNTVTGELLYSLGGHNPPLLFSSSGEQVIPIASEGGFMVGLLERARYTTEKLQMQKGDGILLFTDGVSEAEDLAQEPFSDEKLNDLMSSLHESPTQAIVQNILQAVSAHAGAAAQSDDITVMALRFLGDTTPLPNTVKSNLNGVH